MNQTTVNQKMPALYIGHGAPLLLDDPVWSSQLSSWAKELPKPNSILVVSAHWESNPLTIGSIENKTPLIYDFGGFHPKFYQMEYQSPGAPHLAARVRALMSDSQHVDHQPHRGLDHGAWVPLKIMYPDADIPVLQMSIPTFDPEKLMEIGRRLAPLRDEGVLIVGSGFLTHGLPFLKEFRIEATPPQWSVDFDLWAEDALTRGAVDELMNYKSKAPGMPYAHPTVEHFAPIFVTLGAASHADVAPTTTIDGYWMGLSKRSFQVA